MLTVFAKYFFINTLGLPSLMIEKNRPACNLQTSWFKKGRISIQKFLFCDTYSITSLFGFIHITKNIFINLIPGRMNRL